MMYQILTSTYTMEALFNGTYRQILQLQFNMLIQFLFQKGNKLYNNIMSNLVIH